MPPHSDVLEEDNVALTAGRQAPSRTPLSAPASAARARISIGILVTVALPVALWFAWTWGAPLLWPGGPEIVIQPNFWAFMGVCVLARVVWNLLFLCPRSR